jgi:hypothetical protein
MTLVIAGYDYEKSLQYTWGGVSTSTQDKTEMEICGLFVVADSAITSHEGGRTLLNGFKKVYCIKANLWKPDNWGQIPISFALTQRWRDELSSHDSSSIGKFVT